jgi:hypothetical protein
MRIIGLSILPPLAIGRRGAAAEPLENYDLETPFDGLGFRRIVPAETLYVDEETGAIQRASKPARITFRDGEKIRPVAPFLEVFAHLDDGSLAPLTLDLLGVKRAEEIAIRWRVEVGNIKAFRRTGDPGDKALATVEFTDHEPHALRATAGNFLPGKSLPLGHVRYILPTEAFPGIRLRFTPARGLVYGAQRTRKKPDDFGNIVEETDPILRSEDQIIYNPNGPWVGATDQDAATVTNPGQIFAGFTNKDGLQESWGYLDDECDGLVTVTLTLANGHAMSAFARIGAGPPSFAPDGFPVRTIHDDLLQALLGKEADPAQVTLKDAEDIVRRAAETVRLMNTAVMNGNAVNGLARPASMMPTQDSNDTHRTFQPIVGAGIADTRGILALHQAAIAALRAGTAPWFPDLLRQPENIGDLSDAERRKMPALMRGADGRYMTLTRRQIDTITKVAAAGVYANPGAAAQPANLTAVSAQLGYRGQGNPPVAHPMSAISNCFPGLEFDFRNIWRRLFKGIVLTEHNNYVVEVEDSRLARLLHCRLLAVDGKSVVTQASGPPFPGGNSTTLATADNTEAVTFMEWSNNFARFQDKQGQMVACIFTAAPPPNEMELIWPRPDGDTLQTTTIDLEIRRIFDVEQMAGGPRQRAALARELAQPGELTQGLCSPWQNDYRECACYYWAASRPDYVNIEPGPDGASRGAMWMQRRHDAPYIPDSGGGGSAYDPRLVSYDDLFAKWEDHLRFVVGGRAEDGSEGPST